MAIQIAGNQIKTGAVDSSQIASDSINATKLDLTDNYIFTGQLRAQTPSNDADVVIKSYLDGIVGAGIFWKEPAVASSTGNVNLSNPGVSAFDNKSVTSGARILIKSQSSSSENGVYVFNGSSSAMTRATDCDSAAEINGMAIFVTDGDTNADQAFTQTATVSSLGSDAVTYVRFSGLGQVTAGSALSKSGDTLNVQVDDSSIEVNGSDQLEIKASGVTNAMLAGSISADKLAGSIGDGKLSTITTAAKVSGSAVQLNGSGGLSNLSGLKISDAGVTNAMLAGSIADSKLNQITTGDKVAGSAVQLASGGGLEDATGLAIAPNGIDAGMIQDGEITTAKLAGSIPDSKLATISSSNKVSGSAVQLESGGGLANNSGIGIEANGISDVMISSNAVTADKINFEPDREVLTTNGNDTSFTLSNSLPDNFDEVAVFRNGLFLDRVASNPSGADEFTSSINSGTCTIVFGSAPASTDKVVVQYFKLK